MPTYQQYSLGVSRPCSLEACLNQPKSRPQPRLTDDAHVLHARAGVSNGTINKNNQFTVRRSPPYEESCQGYACKTQFFALLHHCGKLQRVIQTRTLLDLLTPDGEDDFGILKWEDETPDHLREVLGIVASSYEAMLHLCENGTNSARDQEKTPERGTWQTCLLTWLWYGKSYRSLTFFLSIGASASHRSTGCLYAKSWIYT